MKKLKVGPLENLEETEIEMVEFLKNFDLDGISTLYIETLELFECHTYFHFETKRGQAIRFYYAENKEIYNINVWEEETYHLGHICLEEEKKENEQWLIDIWNQFVDHFHLRIRLIFINETTPWKWDTEFTY